MQADCLQTPALSPLVLFKSHLSNRPYKHFANCFHTQQMDSKSHSLPKSRKFLCIYCKSEMVEAPSFLENTHPLNGLCVNTAS